MTNNFLQMCKQCYIKAIINPDELWVTNFLKADQSFKKESSELESSLALEMKRCKKSSDLEKINMGMIVIVQGKQKYYRGLVIDVFNINFRTTYEILLIDYGETIKTDRSKITLLKDKKLRDREPDVFKILLPNIQPVVLEVNYEGLLLEKVFRKRISKTWSTAALNFVKSLFNSDVPVYVKCIKKIDVNTIIGDIYTMEMPENDPKSLYQMLCDKDFAIMLQSGEKCSIKSECDYVEIEKKIPFDALSEKLEKLNQEPSITSKTIVSTISKQISPVMNYPDVNMDVTSTFALKKSKENSDTLTSLYTFENSVESQKNHKRETQNSFPSTPNKKYSIYSLVTRHEELISKQNKNSHN